MRRHWLVTQLFEHGSDLCREQIIEEHLNKRTSEIYNKVAFNIISIKSSIELLNLRLRYV